MRLAHANHSAIRPNSRLRNKARGVRKSAAAAAAILLLVVTVTSACGASGNSQVSGSGPWTETYGIPTNTLLGQYLDTIQQLKRDGDEYTEYAMTLQADYSYGIAGASISALRFAVDNLLYMKGQGASLEEVVGNAYGDWDTIAAISYVSPYPYYFEGMIRHANGQLDAAEACYRNALLNPAFSTDASFLYLSTLKVEELQQLKDILVGIEAEIYAIYTPQAGSLPRDPMNFSDEWLRAKGEEALSGESGDLATAEMYYAAALSADPFEPKNFIAMALLALNREDADSAAYYINEGLWIDPENETLTALGDAMNQAKEQTP